MNVQSIALKVPKTALTRDGSNPTDVTQPGSVIGVWTSASRRKSVIHNGDGTTTQTGPYVQVSRLGNPLVNEAVIPMAFKDAWNADQPAGDSQYAKFVANPELQSLLNVLYAGAFPNLAALASSGKPRADLEAVLLTGIPSGIVPGFQNNTGSTLADQLRLNMAVPPTKKPNPGGLAFGDAAGYPERPPAGRRRCDDRPACGRRSALSADRQDLQGRRGGVARQRRPRLEQHRLPVELPLPRDAGERVRHQAAGGVAMEPAMHTATIEHSHGGPAHSHEVGIGTPASSASVALDIGGGRGALIIYPSERYRGLEIEISAADGDGRRVHTGVHERSSDAGSMLTAIFGSLPAGRVRPLGGRGDRRARPSRCPTERSRKSVWTSGEVTCRARRSLRCGACNG